MEAWCRINFNDCYSNPLYYAPNLLLNDELITDLVIPTTVTYICSYAFSGFDGLTSITIPNTVTSIGEGAFCNCSGLTSITIPNSVTSIGSEAFYGCNNLTSITISNSLTSIDYMTFSYCTGLTSITIPNSVTSIGFSAFQGCSSLSSVTISNSVTSIGSKAFYNCKNITSIIIPKSVKKIDYQAFDFYAFLFDDELELQLSAKSKVYVEWDDPSDETLSFDQQPLSDKIMQYGALYVPNGTKALYEQCDPWRNFFNIEVYTPSGIEEIEAEDGVTIGVEGGKIAVAGAGDAKVEVFGTNGAAVYIGSADNLPELAAGIYIVRVGSTVKKVAIAK